MSDLELQVEKLPFIENALQLPKDEFNKIAKAFINYSEYCDSFLIPDKIQDWCQYLGCANGVCSYKFNDSSKTNYIITTISTPSIPEIRKYCFDVFFCPPVWSASMNYYCLGVLCLLLLITSLFLNIIYLPSFTFHGQRHATNILLTVLASCDVLLIATSIVIDCVPFTHLTHEMQQQMYSKHVARVIPYFLPLQCFFQTMSSWTLCLLLFERYLFQQHGKHAKLIFSSRMTIGTVLFIGLTLFGFAIVRFFEMASRSIPGGHYLVYFTEIGLNTNYHNLVTNLLKVPLEYFGPLLGLVSLLCLIYASLGEQGIPLNKPPEQKLKTYKVLIKNLIIINENEREDRILISILLLSTVAIVVRLPKFVYHILINEEANISPDTLHYMMISYIILDAIFIFIKPFTYIYIFPNYCASLHQYCIASCPGSQDNSGISLTFEQTIANKMRESISYRNSIWAETNDDLNRLERANEKSVQDV